MIKAKVKNDGLHMHKVEKNYESSLDSIPPALPSVKIQILGGKVCFGVKAKFEFSKVC